MQKFILYSLLFLFQPIFSQEIATDKLNSELKTAKSDSVKVNILLNAGNQNFDANPKLALEYFEKALTIAKKDGNPKKLGQAYLSVGAIQSRLSEFKKALTNYELALEVAKKENFQSSIGVCYNNISTAYQAMGNLPLAIDYAIRSLKIYEQMNDARGMANNHANLGSYYYSDKRYDLCINSFSNALKLYQSLNDSAFIAGTYSNLSGTYIILNKYDESLKFALLAIEIQNRMGDTISLTDSYLNVSASYLGKHNLPEALKYGTEALKKAMSVDYVMSIGYAYLNLGNIYFELKDYNTALNNAKNLYAIGKEINSYELLLEAYNLYTKIYEQTGDYKNAYNYHILKTRLNDSIFTIDKNNQISEMQTKYETEKKEKAILELTQKNKIQELDIQQKFLLIVGLSIAAILIIIIIFLSNSRNKLKITTAKTEIEQRLFRSQMNPHFIFNSLIAIQNYVYKHKPAEVAGYISSFAKLMRMILENSRSEAVTIEKEVATLTHYIELQQLRFPDKFTFKIEVDNKIDVDSILIPPMLSQPFIENAIEHGIMNKSNADNFILITFHQLTDMIEIRVKDNGVGRENAKKLKASGAEKHESLATTITQERLDLLNKKGKNKASLEIIDLTDNNGAPIGTEVIIKVPEL